MDGSIVTSATSISKPLHPPRQQTVIDGTCSYRNFTGFLLHIRDSCEEVKRTEADSAMFESKIERVVSKSRDQVVHLRQSHILHRPVQSVSKMGKSSPSHVQQSANCRFTSTSFLRCSSCHGLLTAISLVKRLTTSSQNASEKAGPSQRSPIGAIARSPNGTSACSANIEPGSLLLFLTRAN